MYIADGFPGQRLRVLPRPLVAQALTRPLTSQLLVTDAGFFPHAAEHGMRRETGISQAVVILCASGAGWCRVGSSTLMIQPGQALVIPPGTGHEYGADPEDPWTIWWLHLAGTGVQDLLEAAKVGSDRAVLGVTDFYRVQALAEDVVRRMERDETTTNLVAAAGAAWNLMALLAADQSSAAPLSSPHAKVVALAQESIREQLKTRITVSELASRAGFSPSHFAAIFQQHTGCAVLEYQTQLRMGLARELLDTTDKPVSVVAHETGYRDAFYFSRHFRSVHGMTPTNYRLHRKG